MQELFDDIAIAWQQDPDIVLGAQRPGQRRRHGGETAHPNEVVHFCGDKQNPQETPSFPVTTKNYARTIPISLHCNKQMARNRNAGVLGTSPPRIASQE
jgi:hypothetical protein